MQTLPTGRHPQGSTAAARAAAPTQRVVAFFETLAPSSLQRIGEIYRDDASFKDPFNAVSGVESIRGIFQHMFETTESPRFTVLDAIDDGDRCFLTWNFRFRSRGRGARDWAIHGASRIEFDRAGRIRHHRDYWDAAEEFYEELPWIGALLRSIKRRVRARAANLE